MFMVKLKGDEKMIKRENYPNAYKEVYVILKNMDNEEIKEIPEEVTKKIKEKMNDKYNFELDLDKELKDQILLKETKVILAYLFLNYLATANQSKIIKKKFNNDILKIERGKGKYDGKVFEKIKNENNTNEVEKKQNQIIKYRKGNIFVKLIKFFEKMFNKDRKY